jgi:hypothetical protein
MKGSFVKILFLALIVLSSCTSWKQKDFRKELEKSKQLEARVEVSEDLREKFEIKPAVVEPVKQTPQPVRKKSKVIKVDKTETKVKKKEISTENKIAPNKKDKLTSGALPTDYPEDLKALNDRAKKVWDTYKPNHQLNQKVYLDIHYLGMTVGKIMFTNMGKRMVNNQEVWHFHARFKSAPFYSKIYELNDTVDTYVAADKFVSVRYSLVQRESKFDIDDLLLYDRDKLKTFWFYKQKKSDGGIKNKNKESFIPFYSLDPFSMLFFYQGLPLKDGDIFEVPIVNKGKIRILKSVVEGREVIETEKGKRRAIRVHATTKYTGEHLKDGDMYLWFSDDANRTLIKLKAKIKIGSVTADIVEG